MHRFMLPALAACLLFAFGGRALAEDNPVVRIKTNLGDIIVELDPQRAPKTVENFLSYVRSGHYNGTIFHRVIDGFMIQGGGFDADFNQRPTNDAVGNEADNGLVNEIGTVAMARTNDPHSATAQFFINVGNNEFLNHTAKSPQGWGYTVFGKVTEGMETVDAIRQVKTGARPPYKDVPVETVTIESAEAIEPATSG